MTQTIHYHKQYGKHGVASGTKSRHGKKNTSMPKDGAPPRKTANLRQLCHEQSKEIARLKEQIRLMNINNNGAGNIDIHYNESLQHQRCDCCNHWQVNDEYFVKKGTILFCSTCDLHICKECLVMDDDGTRSLYKFIFSMTRLVNQWNDKLPNTLLATAIDANDASIVKMVLDKVCVSFFCFFFFSAQVLSGQ